MFSKNGNDAWNSVFKRRRAGTRNSKTRGCFQGSGKKFTLVELLACQGIARRATRSTAFTLIELLVVIGIIGLLSALAFPVLNKVRGNAKKASCLNNLHQIGIAINSYVNHYDGHLPICVRVPNDPTDSYSITNVLPLKGKVYECPADINKKYDGKTFAARYGTSYEWNTWLNARFIDKSKIIMGTIEINTPLLGDAESFHGKLGKNYLYPDGKAKAALDDLIQ
ncbi:MAG: type II secretion system protein [Kiritimatiellaeota bacterium]|nr:type II secretion system protein [Kiritimatiellota bacterium]